MCTFIYLVPSIFSYCGSFFATFSFLLYIIIIFYLLITAALVLFLYHVSVHCVAAVNFLIVRLIKEYLIYIHLY